MKRIITIIIFILMALTLAGCDPEETIAQLERDHLTTVEDGLSSYETYRTYVNILSSDVLRSAVLVYNFVGQSQDSSTGSGVIFMEDETHYYALTNHHVIYVEEGESQSVRVHDHMGNIYGATVLFKSNLYDLAVIRFQKDSTALRLVTFADQNAPLGDFVSVIGYPARQINAITLGDVVEYEPIQLTQSDPDIVDITFDVMAMDAPVKGGSSGSMVVDTSFNLVGILFAGTREGAEFTRSYAVPIEKVIEFLDTTGLLDGGGDDA
jgi:S1-C subfamily serine protease